MNNERTPGPWGWEYHPDLGAPIALVGPDKDVMIATGDGSRSWAVIGDADRTLIEHPPDLLDACEAALARLDYLQDLWSKEGITDGLARTLRVAVAKAKGLS